MRKLLAASVLALGLLAPIEAQTLEPPTPESQGMDSAALARLVDYGANVKMDSLVVVRHGRVVAEAYYAPFGREMLHRVNSVTKALVGSLVGIALARGDLPPAQTPVQELLAQAAPAAPDGRWTTVQMQHLLDMTSGMDWNEPLDSLLYPSVREMERSADWTRFVLEQPLKQTPGLVFNYNSGGPHLLAAALRARTGMPVQDYAARHLFAPLSITQHRWRTDPQGVAIGGFGLYLRTLDMARIGVLYLQGGQWNGQQVVPRAWVERVFSPRVEMDIPGYHYADMWWSIPKRRAYFASGFNRQVIMLPPDLGVVAAATGREHYPFNDLITHLERAAASATPLPDNPAAQAALRDAVQKAALGRPMQAAPSPAVVGPPLRGTWQLGDNPYGIRVLRLDFSTQPPTYHVKLRTRDFSGEIGLNHRYGPGNDAGTPVFTRAAWKDANTLLMEQHWAEEAGQLFYEMRFDGRELLFTHTNQYGVRGVVRGQAVD